MRVWAAEIFLNNLPADVRDTLLNPGTEPYPQYGIKRRGFDELYVLVTDSQFVVYGCGDTIDPLLNFFLKDPRIYEHVHFYKTTEASINHLFATATGLCSDLKGARRVEEQIRRCHLDALRGGGLGLTLDNLIRQSLRASKKVRSATGIGDLGKILVDAGMEIVFEQTPNPVDLSYLVVGNGDIAANALEFFYHEGFRNITLASDDEKVSRDLADRYGINYIQKEEVETFIKFSDVIISEDSIERAFPESFENDFILSSGKIFLDFGNDTKSKRVKGDVLLRHYTIEDINNFPNANANVFHSLESAWQMVENEARQAIVELSELQHVPLLASRWRHLIQRGEQEISLLLEGRVAREKSLLVDFFNQSLLRIPRDLDLSMLTKDKRSTESCEESLSLPRVLTTSAKTHLN